MRGLDPRFGFSLYNPLFLSLSGYRYLYLGSTSRTWTLFLRMLTSILRSSAFWCKCYRLLKKKIKGLKPEMRGVFFFARYAYFGAVGSFIFVF